MTQRIDTASFNADHGLAGQMGAFDNGHGRVRLVDKVFKNGKKLVFHFDIGQINREFQDMIKAQVKLGQRIGNGIARRDALVAKRFSLSVMPGKIEEVSELDNA